MGDMFKKSKDFFAGMMKKSDDYLATTMSAKKNNDPDKGKAPAEQASSSGRANNPITIIQEDSDEMGGPSSSTRSRVRPRRDMSTIRPENYIEPGGIIEPDPNDDFPMIDAPMSPDYAAPDTAISHSGPASTLASMNPADRPKAHYFTYRHQARYERPTLHPPTGAIVIRGINDDAVAKYLDEDGTTVLWIVPRIYIASTLPLVSDNNGINPRTVSHYMKTLDRGMVPGPQPLPVPKGHTRGRTVIKGGHFLDFVLAPNDLIVWEHVGGDTRGEWDIPFGQMCYYPFADVKHFDRTQLRHFAWEWLDEYRKRAKATRPCAGIDGVHVWLIDYALDRREEYRGRRVRDDRYVFFGRGARFVEVRDEDVPLEWEDTGEIPAGAKKRFSALLQVLIWNENRGHDGVLGGMPMNYKWPSVGVLGVEFGDF
ncbi:hypothetical protein GE09DRAFT_1214095 [Coniochaeta sp. 2T2.1]|nr:hypothetical protein GE09DRAFT_1214095 [Coniochaeta sp. 2T2.1]